MENSPKKHLHVIGICGVATSAIAIAFHKAGWKVTGSDKGFFPPVSTALEAAGVHFYAGWHPENVGTPDLVLIANASGSHNPETAYVKEHGFPALTDAEIRGKYFGKKNTIVTAGNWGKTSTTAIMAYILKEAAYNPSFVIGGLSLMTDAAELSTGEWSVIEGDEYKTSPWDSRPKFVHFPPTHLLLTSISWDHADLYPTEQSYFKVFEDLISDADTRGSIVACIDSENVRRLAKNAHNLISYGKSAEADYRVNDIVQSSKGLEFTIAHKDKAWQIKSPMLGEFQAQNITGCFAMAHHIGVQVEKIVEAISRFRGLKRRLEKRFDGDVTVIDDIAHNPEKAASILENLRQLYPGKIFAIFEPNIGGRRLEAKAQYANAFKCADEVIIPRLTKLKSAENPADHPIEGDALTKIISETHKGAYYIQNDDEVVRHLVGHAKKGDVIAFLGSHGFRGMIEQTVEALKA